MKKLLLITLTIFSFINLKAQQTTTLNDFGRIILNTYISVQVNIPTEAKTQLENKLSQIVSNFGMGGGDANPRFIITANITTVSKDIIAGAPQMVAQNLDITLFIGDAIDNKIFANTTISAKGVGINENKSFIDAINKLDPKTKAIETFITEGKYKIVSYYNTQCDFIIKEAQTLVQQNKFDEAIYKLSGVPDVCKDCYMKCKDNIVIIYKQKIDAECKKKLQASKNNWAANPAKETAMQIATNLSSVSPEASCINEVKSFIADVQNKITLDDKEKKEFEIKVYADEVELEKARINAYKEISVEFYKNQPKTIIYDNIYWR